MEVLEKRTTESRATFGLFEADLNTGELWKAGRRVKLQGLPFKVLKALLETPGEVVSREQLHVKVWGPDVVVDFEHSLANAVKKLREALGDNADNPVFVETLSRRGFRFIAPVSFMVPQYVVAPPAPAPAIAAAIESVPVQETAPAIVIREKGAADGRNSAGAVRIGLYILVASLSLLLAATSSLLWFARRPAPELPRISQITHDGTIYSPRNLLLGNLSSLATDGSHLFSPSHDKGRVVLSQISLATGASQVLTVPDEIGVPDIQDVSPDGTQLLVRGRLASASQQPLWVVPIDGGSASRVSDVLAQAATWMPDGRGILYASGNQIFIVSLDTGRSTQTATTPGRAFWPRWSPDGTLLRFTIIDTVSHTSSLWEMERGRGRARRILEGRSRFDSECCGTWTADGKHYVFEATREGSTDLWKVDASSSAPVQLTNGPLNFKAPVSGRTGGGIFFVGQDIHSQLDQYDAALKEYAPVHGFLSAASLLTYSRDSAWVAWIDDKSRLWRAKSDGSERLLVTPPSMRVFSLSWSPDGTQIAFMARFANQPWQVFRVRSNGGTPEQLIREDRNLGDPTFSPDGRTLVFGTIPELMGKSEVSSYLGFLDLASRKVTRVPHSEGLYSPKWSPDGRHILALTLAQKNLVLYDTQTGTWQALSSVSADHPTWTRDSRSILFRAFAQEQKPICRIDIQDKKIEQVADLRNFPSGNTLLAEFAGLTPQGTPLMQTELSIGNLYTMDLSQSH